MLSWFRSLFRAKRPAYAFVESWQGRLFVRSYVYALPSSVLLSDGPVSSPTDETALGAAIRVSLARSAASPGVDIDLADKGAMDARRAEFISLAAIEASDREYEREKLLVCVRHAYGSFDIDWHENRVSMNEGNVSVGSSRLPDTMSDVELGRAVFAALARCQIVQPPRKWKGKSGRRS